MVNLKRLLHSGDSRQRIIDDVLSMQKYMQDLSQSLDQKTHALCTEQEKDQDADHNDISNIFGFLPSRTQDFLDKLGESWKWMNEVMRCSSIHLSDAAECHMLHIEAKKVEKFLEKDLETMLQVLEEIKDEQDEVIFDHIKKTDVALKQWATRIGGLKGRASKLHPIEKRVKTLKGWEPAVVMADYEDDQIFLKKNQDILLIDNSHSQHWRVKCGRGLLAWLPSVIVRVPASSEAIDEVIDRGTLKLLAGWGSVLKKAGLLLIKCCLHHMHPHYQQHEISSLKRTNFKTKSSFVEVLDALNNNFSPQWDGHHLFVTLQERISSLKLILEDLNDDGADAKNEENKIVQQKVKLNNISVLYQDLSKGWKGYKVTVESSRSPSFLLLPQQWKDYKEVSLDDVTSYWKLTIPLNLKENQLQYKETMVDMGDLQYEDTIDFIVPSAHSSSISITPHRPVVRLTSLDREVMVDVGGQDNFIPTFKTSSISSLHDDSSPSTATKNPSLGNESVFISDSKIMIRNKPKFQTVNFNLNLSSLRSDQSSSEGSYEEIRTVQSSKEALDNLFDHMGNYSTTTTTLYPTSANIQDFFNTSLNIFPTSSNIQDFSTRSSSETSQTQEGTSLGMATETKIAETEQLTSAEMEEDRTYVIGGVLDKDGDKMVSLKDAISKKIIIPKEGVYVDSATKQKIPISTAMSCGWIKVVKSTVRRSKEKFSSVGIITIRTVKESIRPFVVKKVKDGKDWVDVKEAEKRGLLVDGWVVKGDLKLLISDAAEQDLVQLEYTDKDEAPKPQTEVKSYAVRAVVDTAARKTITFHEAVSKGIICKETGAYKDSSTGEVMYVEEAIMRGYLKGRLMGDVSAMNVDPINQMVVMKKMRKKTSLKAVKSSEGPEEEN